MLNIAVLVSGGGTNLQAVIDAIENGYLDNVRIALVISSSRNAFAVERANKHSIKSAVICKTDFESAEQYENCMIKLIEGEKADLIVLAGFMTILSENFVRRFENRIINVHPSLIPSFCGKGYYGLKVHEEALKKGVKITGATVHFVNALADDGPIILQKAVDVLEGDTPKELQKRVMERGERVILPEAISLISKDKIRITGSVVSIKH